ncbi:MAG: hypothetical protein ACM359_18165 [Bacillota bacterium]
MVEPLEPRTLLSWPNAPFPISKLENTLYVNQLGTAVLTDQQLQPHHEFDGYATYFDDPGKASFQALSKTPLDIAYYDRPGQPTQVAASPRANRSGRITVPVSPEKDTIYLGVQPVTGNPTTNYTLLINGPAANIVTDIPISPQTNVGNHGGVITGENDFDFLKFTIPTTGKWRVTAAPVAPRHPFTTPFDVTMNIYDANGNPVGGTFTHPIDTGGPGAREAWFGSQLKAGATYYVRVDGSGVSEGRYRVDARLIRKRPRKPHQASAPPIQAMSPPPTSGSIVASSIQTETYRIPTVWSYKSLSNVSSDFCI